MRASWWWIDRWRKSTAYTDMTLAERGAYRELLDECWLRDGVIPADDRILARIVGASPQEWKSVMKAVLARFEACEGGLRNVTATEVIRKSKSLSNVRSKAGAKGAAKREANRQAKREATVMSPSPSPSPLPSPSPSPKKRITSSELDIAAEEIFNYWRIRTERSDDNPPKWSKERRACLLKRLQEESGPVKKRVNALKLAVDGALLDPFFNGTETGRTFLDFDNIFRNKGRDRIEKLQGVARKAKPGPPAPKPEEVLPAEDSTAAQKWEEVKAAMSGMIPPHLYRTWFSPTFGWGWTLDSKHPENGYPVLVVTVPSHQHLETLHTVYSKQLKILLEARDVKLLQLHVRAFD